MLGGRMGCCRFCFPGNLGVSKNNGIPTFGVKTWTLPSWILESYVLGPLAKAMGRLNPVADTGLALGIGMARESQRKKT